MTISTDMTFLFPVRSIQLKELDVLQLGDFGFSVQRVQQTLIELGLYDGPIDGYLSTETEKAIRRAQECFQLNATGKCDMLTLRALQAQSFLGF
ncbi:MAG: peptidoglycan-binding domain-containing protein [Limnothrix sp.]